jgi:putative ABC transport system permease protein
MVSIIVFVLALSLIAGMEGSFKNTVFKNIGHAVIFSKGYFDRSDMLPLDRMIQAPDSIINVVKGFKNVTGAYYEIKFPAVLVNGEKSVDVLVRAIATGDTTRFPRYRKGVVSGRFIKKRNEIIIGKPLMELLKLESDKPVVLLSYNTNGGVNAIETKLTGLFETDSREENQNVVFIDHETADELLQNKNIASDIHVLLNNEKKADEFINDIIVKNYTQKNMLEVFAWKTVYKDAGAGLLLLKFLLFLLLTIVCLIITVSIINTQLMAVFERIRDIGTLRSIGFDKSQVISLVVCECLFISLFATVSGVIIGSLIVIYFGHAGIQLGENYGALARMIYPHFSGSSFFVTFAGGLLISLVGSLYPAVVAAKMNPIKALNHN